MPEAKVGKEPVTVADYASQALVLKTLSDAFPDHEFLAEEDSAHLRGQRDDSVGRRVQELVNDALGADASFDAICGWIDRKGKAGARFHWAIDPIDGTKGFLRRAQYAVALGLLERGSPAAGVLVCPNLEVDPTDLSRGRGVIFAAARGEGTTARPLDGGDARPVHANHTTDATTVRVLGSVESSHGDPKLLTDLVEACGFGGGVVRVDSQVKYGVLARGGAEVYLRPRSKPDYRENVWDHAAGAIVASEAGAVVTDMDGKPLDFTLGKRLEENRGVLVTHGPMHAEIVAALAKLSAS